MSSSSPSKSLESKSILMKNIRLNLNTKFIPQDFFPHSISQYCRRSRKSNGECHVQSIIKSPENKGSNPEQNEFLQQTKKIEIMKKRLIKLKQCGDNQNHKQNKRVVSFKRSQNSREGQRKSTSKDSSNSTLIEKDKVRPNKHSRKLMEYMEKMKNVINIDIKFQQDVINPISSKISSKEDVKQCNDDIQTDDSPKTTKRRPKSEINSRQGLKSKQAIKIAHQKMQKISHRPLKIKVKQVNKLMRSSLKSKETNKGVKQYVQEKLKVKSDRYNKFVEIPLDQFGMLTFSGSPDNKGKVSYDSRKYATRTSLPRLSK